jgi:ABC-type lipoprotein release transport system permease subunit
MSNFKKGDKVKINAPKSFANGFTGEIISLTAHVKLSDQLGDWVFNVDDLQSLEKQVKETIKSIDEFKAVVSDNIEDFKQTASESEKTKRKYTKQAK